MTNADVLRSEGLDLVVVISSMSAAHGSANGADGWLRRTVHRRMEREIARLEEAGTAGASASSRAPRPAGHGPRAMAEDRAPRVIEAAYEETRTRGRWRRRSCATLGEPRRRLRRADSGSRRGRPGSSFGPGTPKGGPPWVLTA